MTAIIKLASDWEFKTEKEINSLEDLKAISQYYGKALVIHFDNQNADNIHVMVYDDYIE